jgi:3-oxoacyl-[acyl-carrier-protein] synthase II
LVKVVITGISLISALGVNFEDAWKNLVAGKSGIRIHKPFPELEQRPLGLIGTKPAQVKTLTQQVIDAVLKDAELALPLTDCGVVIGSSRSNQSLWEQMVSGLARSTMGEISSTFPHNFSWLDTLPHTNAIAAARQIGTHGIVLAPMAACATGIWAIGQAANLVQTGQCQRVIAGAVEAPITPLTIAGFQQMGVLAKTGAYPFDLHREGLVLGEGAAAFVVESEELAKRRQAKIYGQILGFGFTADAYHPTSPEPHGKSAIAAIKQCLKHSQLLPEDIDHIHAHGTATQLNDRIESNVIQRLFSRNVPVSSTKGATGHTLGASGALSVAFSLMSVKHQILLPSIGLQNPECDLKFVRVAHHSEIKNVLCFSFGFGGQNAVIALATFCS